MKLSKTVPNPGPRAAFTLIELLVVIAIISILMAISLGAIFKFVGVQESSNTRTTIRVTDAALADSWRKTTTQGEINTTKIATLAPGILPMAGQSGNSVEDAKRQKAIYVSYYLKQQYPRSFKEVLGPNYDGRVDDLATTPPEFYNPLGADPAYLTKLKNLNVKANNVPQSGESSACLLMALEKAVGGSAKLADTFGTFVKPMTFQTTNKGTVEVPVLKDAWGSPIEFFRWTTANDDVEALGPANTKLRNPLDPEGKLLDYVWCNSTVGPKPTSKDYRILFEKSCYHVTKGQDASKNDVPYAYYIAPSLVSAGPDKKLGLNLVTMKVANAADVTDNLYSFKIKRE